VKHPEVFATACPECGRPPGRQCVGRAASTKQRGYHAARILASRDTFQLEPETRRKVDRGGSSTPIPVPHPYYAPIRPPRFRVAHGGRWLPWYIDGLLTWSCRDAMVISRGRHVLAADGAP